MSKFSKKILLKSNSMGMLKKGDNIYDRITSYMSEKKINANPVLASALIREKKIPYNFLSLKTTKTFDLQGLKDEKKIKFVDGINKFKKIYFDYFKNFRYSMEEITALIKENNNFIKKYREIEEKSADKNRSKFDDIKRIYDKNNYNLPKIDGNKNLFGGSLLLSDNENDLKKYIIYGVGSETSNQKSIQYLNKVNNDINERTNEELEDLKLQKKLMSKKERENFRRRLGGIVPSTVLAYYKILNQQKKEIIECKKDIKKLKSTINSIPEIDYFFEVDNKLYLDSLKFFDSRKSSANFSTGVYMDKTTRNDHSISTFCSKKELGGTNPPKMKIISRITYNKDSKKINNKRVSFNPNITSEISSPNPNISSSKDVKKTENQIFGYAFKKRQNVVKVNSDMLNKRKLLESIYNKISVSTDNIKNNKSIQKYLSLKKCSDLPKITPYNISHNVNSIREFLSDGKMMKKAIYLRRNMDYNESNIDKISQKENTTIKSINDLEEKIIKVFSGFKSN